MRGLSAKHGAEGKIGNSKRRRDAEQDQLERAGSKLLNIVQRR